MILKGCSSCCISVRILYKYFNSFLRNNHQYEENIRLQQNMAILSRDNEILKRKVVRYCYTKSEEEKEKWYEILTSHFINVIKIIYFLSFSHTISTIHISSCIRWYFWLTVSTWFARILFVFLYTSSLYIFLFVSHYLLFVI